MTDSLKIKMQRTYQPEREYICDIVFNLFLGLPYHIEWVDDGDPVFIIAYQQAAVRSPDIFFQTSPVDWLRPSSWPKTPLQAVMVGNSFFQDRIPILYGSRKTVGELSVADIDILGSIFFMLTRYEEVNAAEKDSFGRYSHKASIFYKETLLRRPLVNEYVDILKEELKKIAPTITFKKHYYKLSLSHDVDVPITFHYPFADYLKKSFGDLYFRKSPQLMMRRFAGKMLYNYNRSFERDPNYNFRFLIQEEERSGIRGLFNFIPVQGVSPLDSHYDINHPSITQIFKTLSEREFEIGFHPSFGSFENLDQTKKELEILNETLRKIGIGPVVKGRQHYLRWTNPTTWQIWNEIGMQEDSSVGYGMINGFRAGSAYKYTVYDLQNRKHLQLVEEPLIVMDVNSAVNADHQTILNEVSYFANVCRFFNGNFALLYHNNYIISKPQQKIFSEILKIAV